MWAKPLGPPDIKYCLSCFFFSVVVFFSDTKISPPLFPELGASSIPAFDVKVVLVDFLEATKMVFTLHLRHDVDDDDDDDDDDTFTIFVNTIKFIMHLFASEDLKLGSLSHFGFSCGSPPAETFTLGGANFYSGSLGASTIAWTSSSSCYISSQNHGSVTSMGPSNRIVTFQAA